jgi:hypothetical protein
VGLFGLDDVLPIIYISTPLATVLIPPYMILKELLDDFQ